MPPPAVSSPCMSRLERFLGLFARVEAGEGAGGLQLMSAIFMLLIAYYFIKPLREGWLAISDIQGLSKLELRAYSAWLQSLLLLAALPLYSRLAARWPRDRLVLRVGGGFAALLLLFWLCQPGYPLALPYAEVLFYLFVGLFGVTLVAQFWSFAADIYGDSAGRRLFPLVAIGASAGAVVGSWSGEQLLQLPGLGAFDLLLCALLPLALSLWLGLAVARRGEVLGPAAQRARQPAAPGNPGGLRLLTHHPYLAAAALTMLVFNWVVANGDNILFALVQEALRAELAGLEDFDERLKNSTTAFYGNFYFWVNLVGLLLQAFAVSRLLALGGLPLLVLITPVVSCLAYVSMALFPNLTVIKVMKISENASNYSINNTARHILWLPTTKAMLYQAKPVADTLFVRLGDGLAAVTVLLGTRFWHFAPREFLLTNIALAALWIALACYLAAEHRRWSDANRTAEEG